MKRIGWFVVLGAQLLIVIGFWLWNHTQPPTGNVFTGSLSDKLLACGRLAGLLAAFGILFQLILIGRVKWVERVFGLDRLTRLHHIVGFSLVFFLLAHPVLVTAGHAMESESSAWGQFVEFCHYWPGVLSATIALAIMAVAILFSVMIVWKRLRLNYETWHTVHLTLYVAIALAFFHQIAVGGDFTGNRWFAAYWYLLYAFTVGNLLAYRFIRPLWLFLRHRFVVARVTQETGDVTSIYIEGHNMAAFPVEAGQFMIVRFLAPGFRWEAHPFSVSRRPGGKQLRLTIKQLGDFTRRVPDLKPGTRVIIDGAHGIFTMRNSASPKVLMIAGGIGITPIRSLAEEMILAGRDIVLIYANRTRALTVFDKELDELARDSAGRLRIVHVMSNEPNWSGEKGRIDRESIERLVPDLRERDVFLCGPPPMMKSIRSALSSLGVDPARLHYERFAL